MPHLQKVGEAYKDKGVHIIGLSVDKNKSKPRQFFKNSPAPSYTVGWIGDGGMKTFQTPGIPSLFIVDEKGIIRHHILGYSPKGNVLEKKLDALLKN